MIPYYELREVALGGGFSVAPFGILVVVGIGLGIAFAQTRARTLGIPSETINAAMAWALIAGLLASHLEVLLFYDPDPGVSGIFQFWKGMSAYGGFFGALLGLAVYFHRRRRSWWTEADVLIQALVLGWVFGRLGCTLVHDHVGALSDFPLAIRFPGGARHDLGWYEFLYTLLVLLPAVLILNRRPRMPGTTVWVIILLYAPLRFCADFLRQTDLPGADLRYGGLTVAQYASLALTAIGVGVWWKISTSSAALPGHGRARGVACDSEVPSSPQPSP